MSIASIYSSNLQATPFPQSTHLSSRFSRETAPMDKSQKEYLEKTLDQKFNFKKDWECNFGKFTLNTPIQISRVLARFKSLATPSAIYLGGGVMTRTARKIFHPVRDVDFFSTIQSAPEQLSLNQSSHYLSLFLQALTEELKISMCNHGNSKSYFHENKLLITLPSHLDLFRIRDEAGSYFLDALAVDKNSFFVKIPALDGSEKITFDFRLDFGKEAACTNSANGILWPMDAWLEKGENPWVFTAAKGYDIHRSLDLLQRGLYEINPEKASELKGGLKANEPTITNKGILPVDYQGEKVLYEGYLKDYQERGLGGFFQDLLGSLSLHSPDFPSVFASLLNYRSIFASQSKPEEREKLLSDFDRFSGDLLQKIHQKHFPDEIGVNYDPFFLRPLIFWSHCDHPETKIFDCPHHFYPRRYAIAFRRGKIFTIPPWKETVSLLTLHPEGLKKKAEEMALSLKALKLPFDLDPIVEGIKGSDRLKERDPLFPLAPLVRSMVSGSFDPEDFLISFIEAFPFLDKNDLDSLQNFLAGHENKKLALLVASIEEHGSISRFLFEYFSQISISEKRAQIALQKVCESSKGDFPILREIALQFPKYVNKKSFHFFESQIWDSPATFMPFAKAGLFHDYVGSLEKLEKLLPFASDLLRDNFSLWTRFWFRQEAHFASFFPKLYAHLDEDIKRPFLEALPFHSPLIEGVYHHFLQKEETSSLPILSEILKFSVHPHTDFEALEFFLQTLKEAPAESHEKILEELISLGKILKINAFYESLEPKDLFKIGKTNRSAWVDFWQRQCRSGTLPFHFLKQMIHSEHLDLSEKKQLAQIVLQHFLDTKKSGDFFLFWEEINQAGALSSSLVPLLSQVMKKPPSSESIFTYFQAIEQLHRAGIDPRSAFESFSLAWLEIPQVIKPCWKTLEKITGLPSTFPHLSLEWQKEILTQLFKSLTKPDPLSDWRQILEIQTYQAPPFREKLLSAWGVVSRYCNSSPFYQIIPMNGDFSQIIESAIREHHSLEELTQCLLDPRYETLKKEWLFQLLDPLNPDLLSTSNLKALLSSPQFPPALIQKFLAPALSREGFDLPLLPFLEKLGKKNISPQTSEGISLYLKREKVNMNVLKQLIDFETVSIDAVWEAGRSLKPPLKEMIQFSSQCMKKKEEIPSLEKHFTETKESLPWWALEELYNFPHTSPWFRETLLEKMADCIKKAENLEPFLNKYKTPPPIAHVVARCILEKKTTSPEKVFHFFLLHKEQIPMMPAQSVGKILKGLSDFLTSSKMKEILVKIPPSFVPVCFQELLQKNPERALDFLIEYDKDPNSIELSELMFILSSMKVEKIPPPLVLKISDIIFKKIKNSSEPALLRIKALAFVIGFYPPGKMLEREISLFEKLADQIGTSFYSIPEAFQLWERRNKEFLFWMREADPADFLKRQVKDMAEFSAQGFDISNLDFQNLKMRMISSKEGKDLLVGLLQDITMKVRLKKETVINLWKNVWLALKENSFLELENIPKLIHLYQISIVDVSTTQALLAFVALNNICLNVVNKLNVRGLSGEKERAISQAITNVIPELKMISNYLSTKKDINELTFADDSNSEIKGINLLILCRIIELDLLGFASAICSQKDSEHFSYVREILDFLLQGLFAQQKGSLLPLFQKCACVSSQPQDLCALLDRVYLHNQTDPENGVFDSFAQWLVEVKMAGLFYQDLRSIVEGHIQKIRSNKPPSMNE